MDKNAKTKKGWGAVTPLGQGNYMIIASQSLSRVFKLLLFEKRFQKAPLLWRISVNGRSDRRNKAAFSKFLQRSVEKHFFSPTGRLGIEKISYATLDKSQLRGVVIFL